MQQNFWQPNTYSEGGWFCVGQSVWFTLLIFIPEMNKQGYRKGISRISQLYIHEK